MIFIFFSCCFLNDLYTTKYTKMKIYTPSLMAKNQTNAAYLINYDTLSPFKIYNEEKIVNFRFLSRFLAPNNFISENARCVYQTLEFSLSRIGIKIMVCLFFIYHQAEIILLFLSDAYKTISY